MPLAVTHTVPVLRMFDLAKAKEFYVDYLGFAIDWEHRFEPEAPVYMQLSLAGCTIHLSEHHGDGSPGSVVFLRVTGLAEYHAELRAKNYKYLRPGLEDWGHNSTVMQVNDPFGNRIRFDEGKT